MTENDQIIAGIGELARTQGIDGTVEIERLLRIRGGNSSEIWSFDGSWLENGRREERPLILRRGFTNEFAAAGRHAEFAVLRALEPWGLPAPKVFWFDPDGRYLGRPAMIMERCAGTADRYVLTDQNKLGLDATQRMAAAEEMIDILCRLHAIDISGLRLQGGEVDGNPAAQTLSEHDAQIQRLELEPILELRIASWWLWRNLPPSPSNPTIVHGDYRPANMLMKGQRVSAILDWEFTHIGDPLEDLGWYLSPYYAAEHLIPGSWSYDQVVQRYEMGRGIAVDRAALRFWSVFAIYKLAYMTIAALRWLVEGDAARLTVSARFILAPLLRAIARKDG